MLLEAAFAAIICTCSVSGPATATEQADRTTPPPPVVVWPTGIYGLPYAPFGLSACDEMMFYARQFGLPEVPFRGLGWRESNCRNEDGVDTFCCHGYWQMHEMHFRNHPEIYGRICDAWSSADVDSNNPLDKQRQACSAKQLYDAAGLSPW